MTLPRTRFTASAAAVALVATGLLAGSANPATAKTITVCVKKKTGEMLVAKKCKKGWKKKKWSSTGPQGATGPQGIPGVQGPAGPQLSVKDKNGTVLGKFLGVSYTGPDSGVYVAIDGGWYEYEGNGRLYDNSRVYYTDPGCGGTAHLYDPDSDDLQYWLPNVGGPSRVVDRVTNPAYEQARAFALTSTVVPIAGNTTLYYWAAGQVCTATAWTAAPGDSLLALQPVATPPDVPGPLTIS